MRFVGWYGLGFAGLLFDFTGAPQPGHDWAVSLICLEHSSQAMSAIFAYLSKSGILPLPVACSNCLMNMARVSSRSMNFRNRKEPQK
jgi:hypothetical protein